jgi:hypothetical protein
MTTQTDPAIRSAVDAALSAAATENERVVAHRVVRHGADHLVVWLDLEAGRQARLAVWDGALSIGVRARPRDRLRALEVHRSGTLVLDWTAA